MLLLSPGAPAVPVPSGGGRAPEASRGMEQGFCGLQDLAVSQSTLGLGA